MHLEWYQLHVILESIEESHANHFLLNPSRKKLRYRAGIKHGIPQTFPEGASTGDVPAWSPPVLCDPFPQGRGHDSSWSCSSAPRVSPPIWIRDLRQPGQDVPKEGIKGVGGNSLAVHWLGGCASTTGSVQHSQKKSEYQETELNWG